MLKTVPENVRLTEDYVRKEAQDGVRTFTYPYRIQPVRWFQ